MKSIDLEKRIFPCITTCPKFSWRKKLKEAEELKLNSVSFFPEFTPRIEERKLIYPILAKSKIKWIPQVHLSDNSEKWELNFFFNRFKTRFFNIHENNLRTIKKWRGYEKNIYLEYNYDNKILGNSLENIQKIGGLCVDFSHFWAAKNRGAREYAKTVNQAKYVKIGCNHLNGYSSKLKKDLHYARNLKSFDYLKEIPKKYFGGIITLELNNGLKEQLKFKDYIIKLLSIKI